MEGSSIRGKLLEIQRDLKCDKAQYNSFGSFYYRSKEDILEAVKPLAHERGCLVIVDDRIQCVENGWCYIVATATLMDAETGERMQAEGISREPESKKGADTSQVTGMASSYAGKRALGNLFALDDTKDADAHDGAEQQSPASQPFQGHCRSCGLTYMFPAGYTLEQMRSTPCCTRPDWVVG